MSRKITIQYLWAAFLAFNTWISKGIPDRAYLKMIFKGYMGYPLDIDNPKTFNEKIQWLKLNDRNAKYSKLVDKCEVKKYVAEKIGEEYIIPTLGVYNSFDEIDFGSLPEKFILKCTHDSGGFAICKDKKTFNIRKAKRKINYRLKNRFCDKYREWAYKSVKPRVIAEKYMEDKSNPSLRDYKFFCFNGEPKFLYISEGLEHHQTAKISFFQLDGKLLPFHRKDYRPFDTDLVLPDAFEEMIFISKRLAQDIDTPFVRIDLYDIGGKIYFSEITFYPNAGLIPFSSLEADRELGEMMNLT